MSNGRDQKPEGPPKAIQDGDVHVFNPKRDAPDKTTAMPAMPDDGVEATHPEATAAGPPAFTEAAGGEKTAAIDLDAVLFTEAAGGEKTAAIDLDAFLDDGLADPDQSRASPAEPLPDKTSAIDVRQLLGQEPSAPDKALASAQPAFEDADKTSAFDVSQLGFDEPLPVADQTLQTAIPVFEGELPDFQLPDQTMAAGMSGLEAPKPAPKPVVEVPAPTMALDSKQVEARVAAEMAQRAPAPGPTKPPILEVTQGNDVGRMFEILGDETVVGRGLECDVVLRDASVSRKHFKIVKDGPRYRLVDLGSGNGTKLDDQRMSNVPIRHGAKLEAGTTVMQWLWPESVPAPAASDSEKTAAFDSTALASQLAAAQAAAGAKFKSFGEGDDGKTRMGDMAALEVLTDWAPKQAVPEPVEVAATPAKKGGGAVKMVAVMVVLLALGGGGFLVADRFAGLGIVFEKPKPRETVEDPKAQEVRALMEEGLALVKDKEWLAARKKFKEAAEVDPEAKDPAEGLARIASEIEAWKAKEDGEKSLEEEKLEDAIAAFKKIPDASVYYPEAKDFLKQARNAKIQRVLTQAREADDAGDPAKGLTVLAAALKEYPEDGELLGMQEELSRPQEPAATPEVAEGAPDAADADAREVEVAAEIGPSPDAGPVVRAADAAQPAAVPDTKVAAAEPAAAEPAAATASSTTRIATAPTPVTATPSTPSSSTSPTPRTTTSSTPSSSTSSSTSPTPRTATSSTTSSSASTSTSPTPRTATSSTTSSSTSSTTRPATTRTTTTASEERPKRADANTELSAGLQKYASGDFAGAIASFTTVASGRASAKDKARAERLRAAVEKFKTLYGEGMSSAASFRASKAIDALSEARKLDASVSGAYEAKIKSELARQYTYLAHAANSNGDFGKAGSYARKALALDSEDQQAQKIYRDVQGKAQGWLEEAKGLAKDSPEKAMALLQKVLAVFPRDDPRYTEAYNLLNQLAQTEQE
jgi:tetratricopeptide (TPR) repeat protein